MPYKSLVRPRLSQIGARVLIYAANRLREAKWPDLTGHEMAALKRAVDKLDVGIAAAVMRDMGRVAKKPAPVDARSVLDEPAVAYDDEDPNAPRGGER